jgi:[ribosomal protein S5]-alanine N-acetyltransferase
MPEMILTTKRLRIEKIGEGHKKDLFRLLSNPKVHKYFPKTLDDKEKEEFYEKVQHQYNTIGYCFWAVIRIKDETFLGICGLLAQVIEEKNEVEVGYRLSDEFWGQGYGPEAALGCIDYAKAKLNLSSIISLIRPVNLQSIRVAEKNGLAFEKEVMFHDLPHNLYRVLT